CHPRTRIQRPSGSLAAPSASSRRTPTVDHARAACAPRVGTCSQGHQSCDRTPLESEHFDRNPPKSTSSPPRSAAHDPSSLDHSFPRADLLEKEKPTRVGSLLRRIRQPRLCSVY